MREIDGKIGEFVERKVSAQDQLKRMPLEAFVKTGRPHRDVIFDEAARRSDKTAHFASNGLTADDALG